MAEAMPENDDTDFTCYKMDSSPRGMCLIINNEVFYQDAALPRSQEVLGRREGSSRDRDALQATFRNLGFDVECCNNLTDTQMVQCMKVLALHDHSAYDCFVCCILSHGRLGEAYGCNGIAVAIKDFVSEVKPQSCPTLTGKPKLFFLQACQGSGRQIGYPTMERDVVPTEEELIPNEADFLLAYSTVPGFTSYRDPRSGSVYIQHLTECLNKHAQTKDIHDILTIVHLAVGREHNSSGDGHAYKQSPGAFNVLRKKLFLKPIRRGVASTFPDRDESSSVARSVESNTTTPNQTHREHDSGGTEQTFGNVSQILQGIKETGNKISGNSLDTFQTEVKLKTTETVEKSTSTSNVLSLYEACRRGLTDQVKELAVNTDIVNEKDHTGQTPLHIAATHGYKTIVEVLISRGAQMDVANVLGWTPLHVACKQNHLDVVRCLCDNGAQLNTLTNEKKTPLHEASSRGHQAVVLYLLDKGAQINTRDDKGCTPLFTASENAELHVVRILLENGADIDAAMEDGATPLFIAAFCGHAGVVRLLLEHGADINATKQDGTTPLFISSQEGYTDVVKILLGYGAQRDAAMQDGATPLFIACYKGHGDIVKLLLERGAKKDAAKQDGATPLFISSQEGYIDVLKVLLEYGADIDSAMQDGATPLFIASYKGRADIVRLLLQKGANKDAAKADGATPLFTASQYGHAEVAKLLMQHGADANRETTKRLRPLHIASKEGHAEIVKLLQDHGSSSQH